MRPHRASPTPVTDAELVLVAEVARREGWTDLARPPVVGEGHPRSLAEAQAVARFARAAGVAAAPKERGKGLRARLVVAVVCLLALGVCWWVSPTRTAIGLLGAGAFCLIALRRRGKRTRRRPQHPLLGGR